MCGIVGYIGNNPAPAIVYEGLKRLEYRGYDSAGIAALHDGQIFMQKESGKLSALEPHLNKIPENSEIAIGHTRWATHGTPTKANAHPHISGDIAIVHNGIIENYSELKTMLQGHGFVFQSETDTEVIAHLLQYELQQDPQKNLENALIASIKRLEGAYALAIISTSTPERILLAKKGSPLVIGLGEDENYFGSDITVFADKARRAVFLNDDEYASISRDNVLIHGFDGRQKALKASVLDWTPGSADKGGYRHYMLKEIHEQTGVFTRSISRFIDSDGNLNEGELGFEGLDLSKIESIHVIACGTASIAGLVVKYLLEPMTGLPVNVEQASEFRYREPVLKPGKTLVIAISQSGETADTLACIRHAKEKGCQIFSVCNVPYSSIARESDSTLHMKAGPEIGVASTKAFTSQVLCLYLWAVGLSRKLGRMAQQDYEQMVDELHQLPVLVDLAINNEDKIKELVYNYYEAPNFLYVGRGPSYGIALEGALKLKEISYIHAEAYAAGELKHGPIALVDHHMPVVAIAPKDKYYDKTVSNIEEICAREGRVIAIGAPKDDRLASICEALLPCPQVRNEAFQAILSAIPVQLLAYHIAVRRGTDVDQPRNLAKSVTVE